MCVWHKARWMDGKGGETRDLQAKADRYSIGHFVNWWRNACCYQSPGHSSSSLFFSLLPKLEVDFFFFIFFCPLDWAVLLLPFFSFGGLYSLFSILGFDPRKLSVNITERKEGRKKKKIFGSKNHQRERGVVSWPICHRSIQAVLTRFCQSFSISRREKEEKEKTENREISLLFSWEGRQKSILDGQREQDPFGTRQVH